MLDSDWSGWVYNFSLHFTALSSLCVPIQAAPNSYNWVFGLYPYHLLS